MAGFQILIKFDQTSLVSASFKNQHDVVNQTIRKLQAAKQQLQGGDWVGKGAKEFYRDMDDKMLPALKRLADAMQSGADQVTKADKIMKQANEDQKSIWVKIPEIPFFKFG